MEDDRIYLSSGEPVTLGQKLGEGSFGKVVSGFVEAKKLAVAVKLEQRDRVRKCLGQEAEVLSDLQPLPCVPRLLGQGVTSTHSYLVLELLGESVNDRFKKCGRKLSLRTVLELAEKMLIALQCVHALKYVHRDIKPHNFALSLSAQPEVILLDFGLARRFAVYSDARSAGGITGTLPFVSYNVHLGCPYSRRDDLESMGYMFVYLLKGKLPWSASRGEKLSEAAVRRLKEETSIDVLCDGLPAEFAGYLKYVRSLRFAQEPDYSGLKVAFRILAQRSQTPLEGRFDWDIEPRLHRRESVKSAKSTSACSALISNKYSEGENCSIDDSPPQVPPTFPLFDNSFTKANSTSRDHLLQLLILSTASNKRKQAKKFVGIEALGAVVCASKERLKQ